MKTIDFLIRGLFVIMIMVLLCRPVFGYQIELNDFILGIEERPGYHNVRGVALSPDGERFYVPHWQSGTVQVDDPIGVFSTFDHTLIEKIGVGGSAPAQAKH